MAQATANVPTTELGYVTQSGGISKGWAVDDGEETAAWIWPQSVRTADRMRRSGPVHTVLTAVTHPVRRSGIFAIDPQGADPARVAQLAEDLDLPIIGGERKPPLRRRGRFSWLEHVRLALLELEFGHMGFEMVCDPDVLKATGMARLHKLAPRFPTSIAEIDVAPDGGLRSVTQHWSGQGKPTPITIDRLVWYAYDREGAAWQGRPVTRYLYGAWLRLDRLLRARAYLMERQAMGLPVGIAPEGATQDVIDQMGQLAQQSRSADQSGVGIPHGADIRLRGVEGTLPDITAAIHDERAMMADAVMASILRIGTQEASGNRALGETFVDQLTQSQDAIAGGIADVATQHVVEDLWDWNYGSSSPAPAVVARAIDAERDLDPGQLVELIKSGAVTPDDSTEDFLRQRYKLPKRTGARPVPPVAAGRRRPVTAAAKSWKDRVAETLAGLVDAEAIARARVDGSEPADALTAGLSTDPSTVAALLVELWGASYGAGQAKATAKAPTAAARRTTVVVASLSEIIAKAQDIASGILASLADRLASALGADDVPTTADDLASLLAGLGSDSAVAERIALTETHRAEVAGAVDTWASMGIEETRWIRTSGDTNDDDCQALDGTTAAAWDELPPLHPNCSCLLEPA